MAHGVMVTQQILVLLFKVRVLVSQRKPLEKSRGFLYLQSKNKKLQIIINNLELCDDNYLLIRII